MDRTVYVALLASGRRLTAVEVQLLFLEEFQRFYQRGGCEGIVPRAGEILALYADTLEKLHAGDLDAVAGRLDQVLGNFALLNWVMAFVYGLLGLLLIRSETRNPAAWLIVGAGIASAWAETPPSVPRSRTVLSSHSTALGRRAPAGIALPAIRPDASMSWAIDHAEPSNCGRTTLLAPSHHAARSL